MKKDDNLTLRDVINSLESKIDSRADELKDLITKSQDETVEVIKDAITLTDNRFNKVDTKLDEMNLNLKNLDLRTDSLDIRMSHIETATA